MPTTTETTGYYTTTGSVRGDCGHKHRSIRTAVQCLRRDQAGCEMQGGYSDRAVVGVGVGVEMTQDDYRAADAYESGDLS